MPTLRRLLKLLAWLAGILVALLIVVVLVLPLVVDPNDFRDEINTAVERRTGRPLRIHGDLALSVFPWLGMEVERAELGNAPGFGPEPFARIDRADIRVKLLPLLRKTVEVDTVALHGLVLNLERDTSGRTNWADLAPRPGAPAPERQAPPGAALAAVAVEGVELTDSRLEWSDRMSGQRLTLTHLSLSTGALAPGSTTPITAGFDFTLGAPQAQGRVEFAAAAFADPETQRYRLEEALLRVELRSPQLPRSPLAASLGFTAAADLRQETLQVAPLMVAALGARLEGNADAANLLSRPQAKGRLALAVAEPERLREVVAALTGHEPQVEALAESVLRLGYALDLGRETLALSDIQGRLLRIPLRGELEGSGLLGAPRFDGTLALAAFNPREVLAGLGVDPPPLGDPNALTHAAFESRFTASPRQVALGDISGRLDESTLTGNLTVGDFERPVIRYALQLDGLNLDRYLPPPAAGQPAPPTAGGGVATPAGALPLDRLRQLTVEGRLAVGRLQAMNLKSTDIVIGLDGREGRFRLQPLEARLYEGRYRGDVTLDVREPTPRFTLDETLNGVQIGPLLDDLLGRDYVSGVASVKGRLSARGLEPMAVRRTLGGSAEVTIENGTVKGVNLGQLIRRAYALYRKQPAPEEESRETDFTALSATLTIQEGVISNRDLSAKSPLLRVEGEGTVNLVSERIDYLVRTALVGSLEGQGGRELEEVKNLTIPIRVGGTLGDPSWRVDLDPVLKAKAQEAIEREKQRVEERLEERREELERGLEKGLEELLKGR